MIQIINIEDLINLHQQHDQSLNAVLEILTKRFKDKYISYKCPECEIVHTGTVKEIDLVFPKHSDTMEVCPIFYKQLDTPNRDSHPIDIGDDVIIWSDVYEDLG